MHHVWNDGKCHLIQGIPVFFLVGLLLTTTLPLTEGWDSMSDLHFSKDQSSFSSNFSQFWGYALQSESLRQLLGRI